MDKKRFSDSQNIHLLVKNFPEEVKKSLKIKTPLQKKTRKFEKIVVTGKGGCYIAGLLLKEFLDVPVEIYSKNKSYRTKEFNNVLFIFMSYSGNTKEVLYAFNKIMNIKKKSKKEILVITSGGDLLKKAKSSIINLIKLPSGVNPRLYFPYVFFPVLNFLNTSKDLKKEKNKISFISDLLKKERNNLERDAKNLAIKIKNKIPLFYSSESFYPVAYRLQTVIEEDAKIISHSNIITELFHNELESLPNPRFFPVLIIDDVGSKNDLSGFEKQLKFFKKHLKDLYEFKYKNYSKKERMLLAFYFADFLGYHLSLLKNKKMGETPLSDKIKKL